MNDITPRRFGTIGDAADRYGVDVALIWQWITTEKFVTAPDGARVRLVAPAQERQGTLWIVSEVQT